MMIEENQAIEMARQEALANEFRIGSTAPTTIRKERHMRLDKKASGWLIVFDLDVPKELEPNSVMVEVYDDGRVFTPDHL